MIMDRIKLQKEFRQMVKDFDGEKAHNNVAGSVCEHYAIEFAIQQVKSTLAPVSLDEQSEATVCDVLWCTKDAERKLEDRNLCEFHYLKKQTAN